MVPLLFLHLMGGCGPSRQELAGLERILAKDPFPRSNEDFTDALTLLPALPTEAVPCDVSFETELDKAKQDLATWAATHPDVIGRRGTTKPRWLPLQAGRVTIARSPGTAAAQGSASRAARAFALRNFATQPGVDDLPFEEKLAAALALHERDLEPELVVIVGDVDHVYGWLYDPLERRLVCGGQVPTVPGEAMENLGLWIQPNPPTPPELSAVEALTRSAVAALRKVPAPVVAEPAAVATSGDASAGTPSP